MIFFKASDGEIEIAQAELFANWGDIVGAINAANSTPRGASKQHASGAMQEHRLGNAAETHASRHPHQSSTETP
jgi:hypothetical protein